MNTQIPTLYLLLAAVIGIFIGLLLASLFSSKESHPKKEPPKEVVKEGFGEVARLWYSPAGKRILVEMDGGHYKELSAMSKEQQAKTLRLADLLKNWTAGVVETPAAPLNETSPAAYVPIVMDRQTEEVEPYQPGFRELVFEEQEESEGVAASTMPVSPFLSEEQEEADLVSVLQESLDEEEVIDAPALKAEDVTNLSITQQISAILDDMLKEANLSDKGIKLIENEEHGVDVWVGVEKYSDIEEVPYPQVRQLIRDAVMRWEQENASQQRI